MQSSPTTNLSSKSAAPLEVHDLTVAYTKRPVLYGIDLEIPKGSIVGVVGPNGAGKSTLIRAIMGLLPVSSGWIKVFGKPFKQAVTRVGYVPQRESVDWDFPVNALDVVLMGRYGRLGPFKRPSKADKEIAMNCLEKVKMDSYAKRQISNLSGGQQQRFSVACALVNSPKILFLDEPTTGLDPQAKHNLWDLVRELNEAGMTIVLTTHNMEEAESLCQRIAIMDHGNIIAEDTPQKLILTHAPEPPSAPLHGNIEDVFLALTGHGLRD